MMKKIYGCRIILSYLLGAIIGIFSSMMFLYFTRTKCKADDCAKKVKRTFNLIGKKFQ